MMQKDLIQQYIDYAGSKQDAAERLGVSRQLISAMLHGKRSVTPKIAQRIHDDTGGVIRREELVWPEDRA